MKNKTKIFSVPFERDFQKITKINFSKKTSLFQSQKISSRERQKIANPQN